MGKKEKNIKTRSAKQLRYDEFQKGKSNRVDSIINKTKKSSEKISNELVAENDKAISNFYRNKRKEQRSD